jgi:hypothetical protein
MAYAPSVAAEKLRAGAEAGLRQAQIAEANARIDWMKRRGLTPYVDDNGNIYTQDPDNPTMYVDNNGNPPPQGVQIHAVGKQGAGRGPQYDPYALAKDSYDRQMAAWERLPPSAQKRQPQPNLHDIYQQELNSPPIRTASPTSGAQPPAGPAAPAQPTAPTSAAPPARAAAPPGVTPPAPAAQTIKGPAAPVGTIMRDKHGNAVQSLGNGAWKPI